MIVKEVKALWASLIFSQKMRILRGILFLDEINTAPPTVQSAAYQLILDRKIGNYQLPKGWSIVAAGNNISDMGATFHIPAPLANRFIHLDLEVDFASWKEWAYGADIDPLIIAFLSFDSSNLFKFDPETDIKAFATPRSWEYLSRILQFNLKRELKYKLTAGAVGDEVANKFFSFLQVVDKLPDFNTILRGEDVEVEMEANTLFAIVAGLVARAKDSSKEELENIVKFSLKLPNEFSIMLINDLQKSGVELYNLDNFNNWVEKFSHLLES